MFLALIKFRIFFSHFLTILTRNIIVVNENLRTVKYLIFQRCLTTSDSEWLNLSREVEYEHLYKPSVVSVESVGGFVLLYHIHVCVGRVSQEEKICFFSSFLTLPAYTVYRAPVNVCLLLYSLTLN